MERGGRVEAIVGLNMAWRLLGRLGATVIGFCRAVVQLAALMWAIIALAIKPHSWRRSTRKVFAFQLLHTGVNTIAPVALVASLVGIVVLMQAHLWLGKVGQTGWVGPLLVVVVVRELAPLLTNLVIILRNGSEMTVELANMSLSEKVRMLDAQGIAPLLYLVMPRAVAMVVSTFCLTLLFIMFSFASGYLFSFALGLRVAAPSIFLNQMLHALRLEDVLKLLVTGVIPPLLTALICCSAGLSVPAPGGSVPFAARRALSHSVAALFLISVPASILMYL